MNKVTTDVRYVEIDRKHLIAQLELINVNDDQFEISLDSPYAEGLVSGNIVHVNVFVDIFGYDRRDSNREIIVQREEEFELLIEDIVSNEIQFDVEHAGALDFEPLSTLTDYETMLLLGKDAKVLVKFEVR
jgi:hypothetical protein